MCQYGHYRNVYVNDKRKEVKVDYCIADKIVFLNEIGVITYGCCCGHGEYHPQCLVDIKSRLKLEEIGYTLREYSSSHTKQGIYEILL